MTALSPPLDFWPMEMRPAAASQAANNPGREVAHLK